MGVGALCRVVFKVVPIEAGARIEGEESGIVPKPVVRANGSAFRRFDGADEALVAIVNVIKKDKPVKKDFGCEGCSFASACGAERKEIKNAECGKGAEKAC